MILQGRLTKDPLYNVQNGTEKVSFSLAVQQDYKNEQGRREADFIRVSGYGTVAKNVATYAKKGSQLNVTGRLSVRKYEENGETKYFTEVKLEKFYLLDASPIASSEPSSPVSSKPAPGRVNTNTQDYSADELSLFAGQTTTLNPQMATAQKAEADENPF